MGIFSTGSLLIKDENGIFSIWSDKDITITNQGDSMSTQSKIDEIERGGVKKSTNCRQERSGHSPIVICENKQEELNKLYVQLEKEQAVWRKLKEQEDAAKANAEAEKLEREAKIKAEEEIAAARRLEAEEKRALEIEQALQEEADQESTEEIHIESDNVKEEL